MTINMVSDEQKRIWKAEKEQQKRDQLNRPKEVQYRHKELRFGGVKKPSSVVPPNIGGYTATGLPSPPPEELYRRQLGLV
jgi:hypothetical protein